MPRRAGTSPIARRCSTRSPSTASSASGASWARRSTAGEAFDARLSALALAYFRFATRHAALVELMFAAKHRPGAEELEAAAQRAFATVLALIAEAQAAGELVSGDCERIGVTIFATLQGLTAMANGGMLPADELDTTVTDAVGRLLDGLRPR